MNLGWFLLAIALFTLSACCFILVYNFDSYEADEEFYDPIDGQDMQITEVEA